MDISKITPSFTQALEQNHAEQLQALSRVLNLVVGKAQLASVIATQSVSQSERAQMLKQTTAALAQLQKQVANPATATPAVKAEITRLTQQQQLLQSPNLKWVDLMVNNRSLTTYSDRPLQPGQPLLIQLQSPQKLVLLDDQLQDLPDALGKPENFLKPDVMAKLGALLQARGVSLNATQLLALAQILRPRAEQVSADQAVTQDGQGIVKQSSTSPTQALAPPKPDAGKLASLPTETSIEQESDPEVARDNRPTTSLSPKVLAQKFSMPSGPSLDPTTKATQQLLGENLRRLLPHKDLPDQLFAAAQQLQRLPESRRQQALPVSVEQALKSLATRLRTPEQLSQPRQLAQALKDSGVFFEKKLQDLAQSTKPPVTQSKSDNQAGAKPDLSRPTASQEYNSTRTTRLLLQDNKGALLNLLNRASQELTGKPLTSEQTYRLLQTTPAALPGANPSAIGPKEELAQTLVLFIKDLVNRPPKAVVTKEQRVQLLNLIQQQSLHSLAKVQLQQLHGLHQELEARDGSLPTASWQIEIPLRHQTEVQQLQLYIERDWVDEKSEQDSTNSKGKVRQWSVTLRFDLPTLGEFCAQLGVIGSQVNAILWASREKTFTQAREQLDGLRKQLESEGIEVKSLQCLLGMPPPKPLALSYSLIDIST